MENRGTFEVEFTHHFAWGARQEIVWGANYRNTDSETHGNLTFSLNPQDVNMQLFSWFIQDEIALVPAKFYLTVGELHRVQYLTERARGVDS